MTVHCPDQLTPLLTPIAEVRPAPHNPRTGHAVDAIARSLRELGWHAPLVAREDGELIIGHGRLEAAKQLELDRVPVLVVDDSEGKALARMVADNRLTEMSDWDADGLQELIDRSLAVDVDDELAALSGWVDDLDLDAVFGPEEPEPPKKRTPPRITVEHVCPECGHSWAR
jgi:ParB-like chromosome segregation protein Spo0J